MGCASAMESDPINRKYDKILNKAVVTRVVNLIKYLLQKSENTASDHSNEINQQQ